MPLDGRTLTDPLDGARPMKTLVIVILVVFLGFWMVQSPNQLATFAQGAAAWTWDTTTMIFSGVIDFLNALFD